MNTVPRTVVGVMLVYREALTLIDELEYADAAAKLDQVLGDFEAADDTVHSAEAMFWLGFCREKLTQTDLARQTYVTVIQRFAGTTPAEYARLRLDAMNQP
jgi:TolA-binding protein